MPGRAGEAAGRSRLVRKGRVRGEEGRGGGVRVKGLRQGQDYQQIRHMRGVIYRNRPRGVATCLVPLLKVPAAQGVGTAVFWGQ